MTRARQQVSGWVSGLVFAAVVAVACGPRGQDSTRSPAAADAGASEDADDVAQLERPFDELSPEQRRRFMAFRMLPAARELFMSHDSARYESFGCMTCHGEDAKQRGFELPNPSLFALPEDGLWEAATQRDAAMAQFMAEQVVPTVAQVMGRPAYSDKQPDGFGCFDCHPKAGGELLADPS